MGPSASEGGELASRSPLPQPALPAGDAFAIAVKQDGGTLYLRLSGEFDRACVRRVEAALARAATLTRRVVFDLRGLSFLDLGGLRTILRADDRCNSEPVDVVVVRPRGLAGRIFTLTRAGEHLTLVDRPPEP